MVLTCSSKLGLAGIVSLLLFMQSVRIDNALRVFSQDLICLSICSVLVCMVSSVIHSKSSRASRHTWYGCGFCSNLSNPL